MSQALKQSGVASGALAFIYFMNSCATQWRATREGFGFCLWANSTSETQVVGTKAANRRSFKYRSESGGGLAAGR